MKKPLVFLAVAISLATSLALDTTVHGDPTPQRIKRTAEMIAKSAGAEADVTINKMNSVTVNHEDLTEQVVPTLLRVGGGENVFVGPKITASEDFSVYQQRIPGFFFFIGISSKGTDPLKAAPNHSPRFSVDEPGLLLGVRALAHLTAEYMQEKQSKPGQ